MVNVNILEFKTNLIPYSKFQTLIYIQLNSKIILLFYNIIYCTISIRRLSLNYCYTYLCVRVSVRLIPTLVFRSGEKHEWYATHNRQCGGQQK